MQSWLMPRRIGISSHVSIDTSRGEANSTVVHVRPQEFLRRVSSVLGPRQLYRINPVCGLRVWIPQFQRFEPIELRLKSTTSLFSMTVLNPTPTASTILRSIVSTLLQVSQTMGRYTY